MNNKMKMFDPPDGWLYGFPKEISQNTLEDEEKLKSWLLEQNYPDPEMGAKYYRCWEKRHDEN